MHLTDYQRALLEATREKLNELNMENNIADQISDIDSVIDDITDTGFLEFRGAPGSHGGSMYEKPLIIAYRADQIFAYRPTIIEVPTSKVTTVRR